MELPRWSAKPNCDESIAEFFFVPGEDQGRGQSYEYINQLKKICSTCPILEECREYAITHSVMGWWGNTSENQRALIRAERGYIIQPEHHDYGNGVGIRPRETTTDEWEFANV